MEGNKYQNGKIYKIIDLGYSECYIGSTIQPLSKRFGHHCNTYKTHPCASSLILEKYGKENCKVELIENYPCENREQLKAREGYYIENTKCVNKYIPGGSKSDWDKRQYAKNKEQLLEKNKKYREENKETILAQRKSYREANKDKVNERHKEYRRANRETLRAKQSERVLCECGCYSARSSISRHRMSAKHTRLMENITSICKED